MILIDSKTSTFPVLHIVKDLVSYKKGRDLDLINGYYELHQDYHLEIQSIETVGDNGKDLRRLQMDNKN